MKPMLHRERLKIAKSKIVHSCNLCKVNINNLSTEIAHDNERSNFKSVTPPPEFMTDFAYLVNHSKVQKKKGETFNTQDRTSFRSGKLI